MRLSSERIAILSKTLADKLIEGKYLEPVIPRDQIIARMEHIITEELVIEDKINQEVKGLLNAYEREIERGDIDYNKMFNMIKSKLIKERGLVL
ncbi:MAG: DUF507 family protein [Nitrospirae bacterium]|nr:DUF507 family protein [Nitrospirota bacterium]